MEPCLEERDVMKLNYILCTVWMSSVDHTKDNTCTLCCGICVHFNVDNLCALVVIKIYE